MSIILRAAASSSFAAPGTTRGLTVPATTLVGDVLFVVFAADDNGTTNPTITPPVGEGYTAYTPVENTSPTPDLTHFAWWKRAETGDAGAVHTWDVANCAWLGGFMLVVGGVPATGDVNDVAFTSQTGGPSLSITAPNITPNSTPHLELMVANGSDSTASTPAPGLVEVIDVSGLSIGARRRVMLGTPGTRTATQTGTAASNYWIGTHYLLREEPGGEAPPVMVGSGTAAFTATNGATLAPGLPTGWLPDDLHVLLASRSDNNVMTAPSGWTQLTGVAGNATTGFRTEVWVRRAQSGDVAPVITFGTGTIIRGARIIGIRGVPTTSTIDTVIEVASRSANVASNNITFPSVTTISTNTMILALAGYEDDPTAATTMTSFITEADAVVNSALGNGMMMMYQWTTVGTSGSATGILTSTVSGGTFAASPNIGIFLVIKPAPPAVLGAIGISAPSFSGTGDFSTSASGTGASTIGAPSLDGAGTAVGAPVTGTGGVSVGVGVLSGTGVLEYAGAGAIGVSVGAFAGAGVLAYGGAGGVSLSVGVLSGVGVLGYAGAGAFSIGRPLLSSAGVLGYVGAGGVSIGVGVLAGGAASAYTGAGGMGVGAPSVSGVGTLAYVGSGGIGVGVGVLGGTGTLGYAGGGGVSIGVGVLAGVGELAYAGAGGVGVGVGVLGGTGGFSGLVGGGGFFMVGPPTYAGAGELAYAGAGGVLVGHPFVSGDATYASVSVGSGGVFVGHAAFDGAALLGYEGSGAVSVGVGSLNGDGYLTYAGVGDVSIGVGAFNAEGEFYIPTVVGIGSVVLIGPTFGGEGGYVAAPIAGVGGVGVGVGVLSGVGLVVGLLPPIVGHPKAVLLDTAVRAALMGDRTGVAVLSGNTYAQEI